MSTFVRTRSPIQCRSQCQKLLRKHKTFYNVIVSFRNELPANRYEKQYAELSHDPLIRFKGSFEMAASEEQRHRAREVACQTDRSYLLKKFRKRPVRVKVELKGESEGEGKGEDEGD
jgi:hypothetical protein